MTAPDFFENYNRNSDCKSSQLQLICLICAYLCIYGAYGNNLIDGGAGDDQLYIGTSAYYNYRDYENTFVGGLGDDFMMGRQSQDTYIYNHGDGNDTIENRDGNQNTDIIATFIY